MNYVDVSYYEGDNAVGGKFCSRWHNILVVSHYFAHMRLLPKYAKLPVSTNVVIIGLLVLMLVLWFQGGPTTIYSHLFLLSASYLIWGIFLPFIQGIVVTIRWKERKTIVQCAFWAIILILIHFIGSNIIYYLLKMTFEKGATLPKWDEIKSFLTPSILGRLVDFIMFFSLLSWINQSQMLSAKKVDLAKAETLIQRSKLQSLKNQLNPHFLFNTLHAIYTQIGVNDDKARNVTVKISSFLRRTLNAQEKDTHPLEEELDIVNEYLDIEYERFSDRLTINKIIDEGCLSFAVPTMLLQPIIENAFKHGISLKEGKTFLNIVISKSGSTLQFEITNEFDPNVTPLPSTGIGLNNLRQRLRIYYENDFCLNTIKSSHQFKTILRIPLK